MDFVDCNGLGRWGEGGDLVLSNNANSQETHEWIAKAYDQRFPHTLLAWSFSGQSDIDNFNKPYDFVIRRDSFGSQWFDDKSKAAILLEFPKYPIMAERCYWTWNEIGDKPWSSQGGSKDPKYGSVWKGWQDCDTTAVEQALEYHANTLDLRTVPDTARFMSYPDVILRFRKQGGYRFYPSSINFPDSLHPGMTFKLQCHWINSGVGVLPNLNKRWASKYRAAWALLDPTTNKVVGDPNVDKDYEPGEEVSTYVRYIGTMFTIPASTPPGKYKLACAILNTAKDGMPDLNLALKVEHVGPWYVVGTVDVAAP